MIVLAAEEGQGLTEYALIIALIALLLIGALSLITPALSGVFSHIASGLIN